jgi:hypothetical protein
MLDNIKDLLLENISENNDEIYQQNNDKDSNILLNDVRIDKSTTKNKELNVIKYESNILNKFHKIKDIFKQNAK